MPGREGLGSQHRARERVRGEMGGTYRHRGLRRRRARRAAGRPFGTLEMTGVNAIVLRREAGRLTVGEALSECRGARERADGRLGVEVQRVPDAHRRVLA